MTAPDAVQSSTMTHRWPLTTDARAHFLEEIARMREDLAVLTGQGLEEEIVRPPLRPACQEPRSIDA